MGVSRGYHCGHQRRAWNAKAATAATKTPVCKHRSLSTPPLPGACAAATTRVLWSRDNFPGRTHTMPQAVATSRWPLPPQACPAFCTLPPHILSEPEPLNQHSFYPLLSEWRTDALRWPTHRGRSKSKAEPQELCEQRREREISPSSLRSSRLNLHNQLDVPCICGIPE